MIKTETFGITGMTCSSCALAIARKLNAIEGVESATVNFAMAKAVISFDDTSAKREHFVNQIHDLGYGVITENTNKSTVRGREKRGGCCGRTKKFSP